MANILGTTGKPFETEVLRQLHHGVHTMEGLKPAKYYILSYFAHCISTNGIVMWCPEICIFEFKMIEDVKRQLICSDVIMIQTPGSDKRTKYSLQNWFFHEHDELYRLGCDPRK